MSGVASLLPAELGVLAEAGLAPGTLTTLRDESRRLGVTPTAVARARGLIDETALSRGLARATGLAFTAHPPPVAAATPYPACLIAGLAPLGPNRAGHDFLIAPVAGGIERLAALGRRRDGARLLVTTPSAFRAAVAAGLGPAIHDRAVNRLGDERPGASARDGASPAQKALLAGFVGGAALLAATAPWTAFLVGSLLFGLLFALNLAIRLAAVFEPGEESDLPPPVIADSDLPIYTLLVPLYREARVLPQLVAGLGRLDYPPEKLDIKLLIEADDPETRAAAEALDLPGTFEIVIAPPGRPRTKPRALNIGLDGARGEFCVVYDAEDVPARDQLRLGVARFRAEPASIACLQGRLSIDNTDDAWLTRLFTVEYATLFDVTIPGLAALGLPVMLGGTTNHFRVQALRRVGGWDAWNVTEDADLGFRLARAAYGVADLPSTTLEEAPARLDAWMHQRTRWLKGWMQTTIVLMRRPREAIGGMGLVGYASSLAIALGTLAAALIGPAFFAVATLAIALGELQRAGEAGSIAVAAVALMLFGAGLATTLLGAVFGIRERKLWPLLPWLATLPAYYLLVSVAGWRALHELLTAPQRWNKTEHGLARSSRTGLRAPSKLV